MAKKRSKIEFKYANPDISFVEYFQLSPKVKLVKGDKIKVKGERGTFIFGSHVRNEKLKTEWIECTQDSKRRAFRPDRIVKRIKNVKSS